MPDHSRLVAKLLLVVVGMFGFGFAMIPIYSVFCEITGLNGKPTAGVVAETDKVPVDETRTLTMQFVANVDSRGAWSFEPTVGSIQIHPGEVREATFKARNLNGKAVVAQAIPSVAPGEAAVYVKKFQCFCYDKQKFAKDEEKSMVVRFRINPDIPKTINTLTLAYTFFTLDDDASNPAEKPAG